MGAAHEAEGYQGRALRMFRDIRELGQNLTVLLIDHVSDEGAHQARPGIVKPYGSIFKFNEVRWAWEVRKSQQVGSPLLTIGLFHAKHNHARYLGSIGFTLDFSLDDVVSVSRSDPQDNGELAERVALQERMYRILIREGPQTDAELSNWLAARPDTIRKTVSRHSRLFSTLADGRRAATARNTREVELPSAGVENGRYHPEKDRVEILETYIPGFD